MWSLVQYRQIGRDVEREWARRDTASRHQQVDGERRTISTLQRSNLPPQDADPEQQPAKESSDGKEKESNEKKEQDDKHTIKPTGPNDPIDPHNWPLSKRIRALLVLSLLVFTQAWAGACDSLANTKASEYYHVSPVAQNLTTAMYLFGIGSGCLFVGPLSQTFGRNPVYLGFTLVYLFFILGTALSRTFGAQIVCRFFAGLASSAALGINGGSVGDLFRPVERALWFPVIAWVNVVREYLEGRNSRLDGR
jgi:DHA1 family multidrug resistance protein-like MFS transporter